MNQVSAASGKAKLIRTLIFLTITGCMLAYLCAVFGPRSGDEITPNQLYNEKHNTLDAIFIGSSAAYRFWIPTQAYDDYGMTVFMSATPSQPVTMAKYIMESTRDKHEDVVYLIELKNLIKRDPFRIEADFRRYTDSMPYSADRSGAIDANLEYFSDCGVDMDYNKIDYMIPFIKYHARWQYDIEAADFTGKKNYAKYKGFITAGGGFDTTPLEDPGIITTEEAISPATEKALVDLLEYCKTIDNKVVFVSAPFAGEKWKHERMNYISRKCRDYGFTVWDFNSEPLKSQLDMDWSSDYYDQYHCNIHGAQRYTDFLANMLDVNLDFADHRGQTGYESWEIASEAIKERLKENGFN